MKTIGSEARVAVFVSLLAFGVAVFAGAAGTFPDPPAEMSQTGTGQQIAVLAGGCFWGMEGVFERLEGVKEVVSGYSGGDAQSAQYEIVSTGTTGHAESVQITYDPAVISYGTLLKVFFSIAHDPTELNYQGSDHGSQYRSAIFYATEAQKNEAEAYIRELSAAKVFNQRIVTQVVPLSAFYPAEAYHQHFLDLHPDNPYIAYWDLPKLADLNETYPELVASR